MVENRSSQVSVKDAEFRRLTVSQASHGSLRDKVVGAGEDYGWKIPAEGPYRRHLVKLIAPIAVSERQAADADRAQMSGFLAEFNKGARAPRDMIVGYSNIGDSELRVSVRIGEIIASAATKRGVEIEVPGGDKGDEWLSLASKSVMSALGVHSPNVVERVLREARGMVDSMGLNGDRSAVLQGITELIETVNAKKLVDTSPTMFNLVDDLMLGKIKFAVNNGNRAVIAGLNSFGKFLRRG